MADRSYLLVFLALCFVQGALLIRLVRRARPAWRWRLAVPVAAVPLPLALLATAAFSYREDAAGSSILAGTAAIGFLVAMAAAFAMAASRAR